MRARAMPTPLENRPAEQDRVTPKPAVGPAFGSIMLCAHSPGFAAAQPGIGLSSFSIVPGFHFVQPGLQIKRKRNAGRRISPNLRALRARLALSGARSPDGVPPRHLLQRPNATAQLQYALPGTERHQVLPASGLSQSSGLPRRPVVMPDGRMTRSRPGAEVTSPRPREPLSLRQPGSPAAVLSVSEIRGL